MAAFDRPFDLVHRIAESDPDRPALVSATTTLTYAELDLAARRVAEFLREYGVRPGQFVALNVPDIIDTIMTVALFHEAAVPFPFTDSVTVLELLEAPLVITSSMIADIPTERQLVIDDDWLATLMRPSPDLTPNRYQSEDDILTFMFSSGTTGRPKAMAMSIGLLNKRVIETTPEHFREGGHMWLGAARIGPGWFYRYQKFVDGSPYFLHVAGQSLVDLLRAHGIRHAQGSPTQLAMLADEAEQRGTSLPALTHIRNAGGVLPIPVADRLRAIAPQVEFTNGYGATEVQGVAHRKGRLEDIALAGDIYDYCTAEIVDEDTREPLAPGEVGLIRVKTPYMIDGYYRDPENTARFFVDGWFYPGDRGYLDGQTLYLAGRATEVINAGGIKVDPNHIDNVVLALPGIRACASFAINRGGADQVGIAYVSDTELDEEWLAGEAREKLSASSPRAWFRVDTIPLGATGKPLRRELSERYSTTA